MSATAGAHEVGVSRGTYQMGDGKVVATVALSRRELGQAFPWLRGPTGNESLVAFEENRARLGAWLTSGLTVSADEQACLPTFDGMRWESDGLELLASYACPPRQGETREVTLDLAFLAQLSQGHRHFATWTVSSKARSEPEKDASTGEHRPEESNTGNAVATFEQRRLVILTGTSREPHRADRPPQPNTLAAMMQLGAWHIFTGYDHLLFLLGVVLPGGRWRSLLGAVTAFTAGHSITLAFAALSAWMPSARFVEPCIALSIVYVGVENWFGKANSSTGRWKITLLFGWVHGFGFASALREIAIPRRDLPTALLGFNLGVEAGQLAVLAVLLPLVHALSKSSHWQRFGMRACTALVALAGVTWFVARVV